MIKISLIKWLIHFFGFKKSAIDATFTSIELSKSTTQAYNATSEALEVVRSIGSLAKGVSTAAKTFEDKMEEIRKNRLATQKEREAAYIEQIKIRREEEKLRHREAMLRIMEARKKLKAHPKYAKLQEWLKQVDAEFDAMMNESKQRYQSKPAKLVNNKPKVIEHKTKAKYDVFK